MTERDDKIRLLQHLIELDYKRAEQSLAHFVKAAWSILEPGKKLIWNWHHDVVCNHLEAVVNFVTGRPGPKIQNLIINIPFGSTKTTIASICLTPWIWTRDPWVRVMGLCHSKDLASRDSVATRNIIESDWYQRKWGQKVAFSKDQREKTRYVNAKRGGRLSFGITQRGTGEHVDIMGIDDPHDAEQAMYSRVILDKAVNAYRAKWTSRVNNPKKSGKFLIMQRVNMDDLSGYCQDSEEEWTHLCIPFEYNKEVVYPPTPLGYTDPRTEEGQLYWPEMYDTKWFNAQAVDLGAYGVACQLQQQPIPLKGGMVDIGWFRRYEGRYTPADREEFSEIVQAWDTAQKGDELVNAPWVGITAGWKDGDIYILDVYRDWHNYPQGKDMVVAQAAHWYPNNIVVENRSTGESIIQDLSEETRFNFWPEYPEKDKVTRLGVQSKTIRAGRVWLPEKAHWLPTFEREIASFPFSNYKDQADCLSMLIKYLTEAAWRQVGSIENTEDWPDEEIDLDPFGVNRPLQGDPGRHIW